MKAWTVEVEYTTERPIRPKQWWTRVRVAAVDSVDAQLVAAQMVGTHAVMVTSTLIVDWED